MKRPLAVFIAWKDIRHPAAGGAELMLMEISRRLVAGGWRVVHVVAGFAGARPTERVDGVLVSRVGRGILWFPLTLYRYRRRFRHRARLLVDVFNCFGSGACLLPGAARPAFMIFHVQDRMWFHQTVFPGVPSWIVPLFNAVGFLGEKLQLALTALLFRGPALALSESTRKDLQSLGFPRRRVNLFAAACVTRPLADPAAAAKAPAFTVITIGPRRSKRPHHVLEAFRLFAADHPEARLQIAGWGTELERLRRTAAQHGMRQVEFIGRVDDARRDELLEKAHVMCAASVKEGWGLVVIEANARGTPVIAYDVPGLRDALAFGNGLLCPPTPAAMADALRTMHDLWKNRPDEYEALRRRGLEVARGMTFDRTYADFAAALDLENPAPPG